MSTNNFIQINGKDFTVSDCDADIGAAILIGKAKTPNEVIGTAQKYQKEEIVE